MGKLARGALWVAFPPAGAVASIRHGIRQRHDDTLAAVVEVREPAPSSPDAVREIAARLAADGVPKNEALRLTARAMTYVHRGASLDDALAYAKGTKTWDRS